jgi:hypothetical protein
MAATRASDSNSSGSSAPSSTRCAPASESTVASVFGIPDLVFTKFKLAVFVDSDFGLVAIMQLCRLAFCGIDRDSYIEDLVVDDFLPRFVG